ISKRRNGFLNLKNFPHGRRSTTRQTAGHHGNEQKVRNPALHQVSLISNGSTFSRELRESSFWTWIFFERGSSAATWCYASSLSAVTFGSRLIVALLEGAHAVLPLWCSQDRLRFRQRRPRPFATRSIPVRVGRVLHSSLVDIFL